MSTHAVPCTACVMAVMAEQETSRVTHSSAAPQSPSTDGDGYRDHCDHRHYQAFLSRTSLHYYLPSAQPGGCRPAARTTLGPAALGKCVRVATR